MDKEKYERGNEEIAPFAESEVAYHDPDSPVIWKQYYIGPVPLWRRLLWWFFPPSRAKMRRIQRRYSDRLSREMDRVWRKVNGESVPAARNMLRVILLTMVGPVILSAVGPAYYGFTDGPYWRVVVWALACVIPFVWYARPSFKHALSTAPPSRIGRSLLVLVIIIIAAIVLVVLPAHSRDAPAMAIEC